MILFIQFLLFSFINQIKAEEYYKNTRWTKEQFEELCLNEDNKLFLEKLKQFKLHYPRQCKKK